MHLFDQAHYGPASSDPAQLARLKRNIHGVHVEVRADVGSVELPVSRVLDLRPGDVVELGQAVRDGVTLVVGETPAYRASPGRNGKLRAVQVRGPVGEPG
jgi:flagellar motor switch protein FliM